MKVAEKVIVDTGVLIGLLNKKDSHHAWSKNIAMQHKAPFYTCEAVITEAAYLLSRSIAGRTGFLMLMEMIEAELIKVDFDLFNNIGRVSVLAEKYEGMDFADACLVAMTEQPRFKNCLVLTIDRKDFSVYRRNKNEEIPFLSPPIT